MRGPSTPAQAFRAAPGEELVRL